jgi:hypothetical protein
MLPVAKEIGTVEKILSILALKYRMTGILLNLHQQIPLSAIDTRLSPLSAQRTLCPSSIPAGMVTLIFFFTGNVSCFRNSPVHLSLITFPLPSALRTGLHILHHTEDRDCCV